MKFIEYFLLLTAVSAISTSKLIGKNQRLNELCDAIYRATFASDQKNQQQKALDYIGKHSVSELAAILCGGESSGGGYSDPGSSVIKWLSYWTYKDRYCDQLYPIAKALINKGVTPTEDDTKQINYRNPCQKIKDCLLNKNCP